jgi:hypothetical protein
MRLEKGSPKVVSPLHSWRQSPQRIILAVLTGVFLLASLAKAQEDATAANPGISTQQSSVSSQAVKRSHPFWDKDNILLFAGVGAGRALDYVSTRHFRDRGVNEWLLTNSIVDNKPLFAGIEVAGVAASIGVSYLFHRSGHHKLERWVSIVHIGAGVGGSAWNYTLKPSPPPSAPH